MDTWDETLRRRMQSSLRAVWFMSTRVAGVVLAGGRGSRMGQQPKVLMELGGVSLLERSLRRTAEQLALYCLSSNLPPEDLEGVGCAVVRDPVPGYRGPLAGICAAMEFFRESHPEVEWICSVAADTPWFPLDLVDRLQKALCDSRDANIVVARSGGRDHPVFALWSTAVLPALREVLERGTELSLARFQARFRLATATWPIDDVDPFFNLNTPADLEQARTYHRERGDRAPRIR